jgi:hypothetical protein
METLPHIEPCSNCDLLKTVQTFPEWQHHYKFCTIYCMFVQVMNSLRAEGTAEVYIPSKMRDTCAALTDVSLRSRCLSLSEELPGPAETAFFNCDRYEEYLRLLNTLIVTHEKTADLQQDMDIYLKPFENDDRHPWMDTWFDLHHSISDSLFAQDLIEAFADHLPSSYAAKCHQH